MKIILSVSKPGGKINTIQELINSVINWAGKLKPTTIVIWWERYPTVNTPRIKEKSLIQCLIIYVA